MVCIFSFLPNAAHWLQIACVFVCYSDSNRREFEKENEFFFNPYEAALQFGENGHDTSNRVFSKAQIFFKVRHLIEKFPTNKLFYKLIDDS